jgi:hypothetical protein
VLLKMVPGPEVHTERADLAVGDRKGADRSVPGGRFWELISSLPDGLDTIAGDRGYRFSGGDVGGIGVRSGQQA